MKDKLIIGAKSVTAVEKAGSKNGCRAKKSAGLHTSAKSKFAFAVLYLFCFTLPIHALAPYRIKGEVSAGSDTAFYEYGCVALTFYNASKRTVRKFSVVVFLSGNDEMISFSNENPIVLECDENVAPRTAVRREFGLDDYISEMQDEACQIDFLYVSKIEYDDGGVWEDPYGVYAK